MIRQGDIITKEDTTENVYFSSFQDKYAVMDNLDYSDNPYVPAQKEIYNSEYVWVVVVLRGCLHINAGGTDIDVRANDYFVSLPCMQLKTKESRAIFFSFFTRSHLMTDIYEHSGIIAKIPLRAFVFRHFTFTKEEIDILLDCYLMSKKEHLRENYPLKELVLRSYQTAYLSRLFSFLNPETEHPHIKNTRQYAFYTEFLSKLNEMHKVERSVQFYAKELSITPKYLSTITQSFTGLSASQVIDQYVIYAIKQTLYDNKKNIKTISSEYNFPSQSFFGRYFKRITGLSPNEYIKKHNRKSLSFESNNE